MSILVRIRDHVRRDQRDQAIDPCRVRAIPGAIPQSPLEERVRDFLAAYPTCSWESLVADVADYLRRSERLDVLASLDEGLWGSWMWPAMAQEALQRLVGTLLEIEAPVSPTADISLPAPASRLRPVRSPGR